MRFLQVVCIFLMIGAALSVHAQNCLVSKYELDNGVANDTAGSNDGIINGGPVSTADKNGNPGEAMYFDGVDDYVDLGDDFDYKRRTISVWFQIDSIYSSSGQLIYGSDHPGLNWGLTKLNPIINNGTDALKYAVGNTSPSTHIEPINEDQWYMATIVVDSNQADFYLDCQHVGSAPNAYVTSQSASDNYAHIATSRNHNNFYNGSVDDLRIYDCALSVNEICDLYTTGHNELKSQVQYSKVYPNPSEGEIYIEWGGNGSPVSMVKVYRPNGQVVHQENTLERSGEIRLHPELRPGFYYVTLYNDDGIRMNTEKIVIR